MLWHVLRLPSFLWLHNILLCDYTTLCLSINPWTFGLSLPFGSYEYCCYEHSYTRFCLKPHFQLLWGYIWVKNFSVIILILTCWEKAKLFSLYLRHLQPVILCECSSLFTSLSTLVVFCVLEGGDPIRYEVVLYFAMYIAHPHICACYMWDYYTH